MRFDAFTPVHELVQVSFAENPAEPQTLHVVGGDFRLIGAQGLLDGIVDVPQHTEQLTGTQAQAVQRRTVQLALQCLRHGRQQAEPAGLMIDRDQKGLALQQTVEHPTGLLPLPELLAKLSAGLGQMREAEQDLQLCFAQARQQFPVEVLAEQ
ncbi:hypothetical protein D3C85_1009710 [compost metagenome]